MRLDHFNQYIAKPAKTFLKRDDNPTLTETHALLAQLSPMANPVLYSRTQKNGALQDMRALTKMQASQLNQKGSVVVCLREMPVKRSTPPAIPYFSWGYTPKSTGTTTLLLEVEQWGKETYRIHYKDDTEELDRLYTQTINKPEQMTVMETSAFKETKDVSKADINPAFSKTLTIN